eukprot:2966394-Prymnesium_polylepis.1
MTNDACSHQLAGNSRLTEPWPDVIQTWSRHLPDARQTCQTCQTRDAQPDIQTLPDAARRCQALPDAKQGARTTHDVQARLGLQPDAQTCQTCQMSRRARP